jgi:hypothetical protein
MSIALMSVVWEIEWPTQSQLLIALKLADYANDDGSSIYPARETLGRKARCSLATVSATLKAFRDIGLLEVVRQGGQGPGSTTEYKLNISLLLDLAMGKATIAGCATGLEITCENPVEDKGPAVGPLDEKRVQLIALRVQSTLKKGPTVGPNPSVYNHHIDSSARERACEPEPSHASRAGNARLVIAGDASWRLWLNHTLHAMSRQAYDAFRAEGAMVVYAPRPFNGCPDPKLAPGKGSAKWVELAEARTQSLSDRITGEAS